MAFCDPVRPGIGRHAVCDDAQCDSTGHDTFYYRFAGKASVGDDDEEYDTGQPPGAKPGKEELRLPAFAAASQGQDVG